MCMPRFRFSILQLVALITCVALLSPWWLDWFDSVPSNVKVKRKTATTTTVQLPILSSTSVNTVVSVPDGGVVMFGG